jgi:hypothetical protein
MLPPGLVFADRVRNSSYDRRMRHVLTTYACV